MSHANPIGDSHPQTPIPPNLDTLPRQLPFPTYPKQTLLTHKSQTQPSQLIPHLSLNPFPPYFTSNFPKTQTFHKLTLQKPHLPSTYPPLCTKNNQFLITHSPLSLHFPNIQKQPTSSIPSNNQRNNSYNKPTKKPKNL